VIGVAHETISVPNPAETHDDLLTAIGADHASRKVWNGNSGKITLCPFTFCGGPAFKKASAIG
jgi:hypothetical protein